MLLYFDSRSSSISLTHPHMYAHLHKKNGKREKATRSDEFGVSVVQTLLRKTGLTVLHVILYLTTLKIF